MTEKYVEKSAKEIRPIDISIYNGTAFSRNNLEALLDTNSYTWVIKPNTMNIIDYLPTASEENKQKYLNSLEQWSFIQIKKTSAVEGIKLSVPIGDDQSNYSELFISTRMEYVFSPVPGAETKGIEKLLSFISRKNYAQNIRRELQKEIRRMLFQSTLDECWEVLLNTTSAPIRQKIEPELTKKVYATMSQKLNRYGLRLVDTGFYLRTISQDWAEMSAQRRKKHYVRMLQYLREIVDQKTALENAKYILTSAELKTRKHLELLEKQYAIRLEKLNGVLEVIGKGYKELTAVRMDGKIALEREKWETEVEMERKRRKTIIVGEEAKRERIPEDLRTQAFYDHAAEFIKKTSGGELPENTTVIVNEHVDVQNIGGGNNIGSLKSNKSEESK